MRQRGKPSRRAGTRFRLFPSYAEGYTEPELVEVSLPPGSIGPGPSDAWMYARNPISKGEPYDPPFYVPPYNGPIYPPAIPGRRGHFDEIAFGTEQFLAAHTYGTVRLVLDIWEHYLARPIVWWHADVIPRVELIPTVQWQNAQSGPGFIEMGQEPDSIGRLQPFCLNFDVLAHETGHGILFSQIGVAPDVTEAFLAFHESLRRFDIDGLRIAFPIGAHATSAADMGQSLFAQCADPVWRIFRYAAAPHCLKPNDNGRGGGYTS